MILSSIINDCEVESNNDNDDIDSVINDIDIDNDGYVGNRGNVDDDAGDCIAGEGGDEGINGEDDGENNDAGGDRGENGCNCDGDNGDTNNDPGCDCGGDACSFDIVDESI